MATTEKPNILLILADDIGWFDVARALQRPPLQAICSTSRATMPRMYALPKCPIWIAMRF
jgi:hypothetical protein